MRRRRFFATVGAAVTGLTSMAGCLQNGSVDALRQQEQPYETQTPTEGAPGTETAMPGPEDVPNTVRMVGLDEESIYFNPVGLYVEPGETITWVVDSGSHTTTAFAEDAADVSATRIPEDAEPWDSGIMIQTGDEFSYTFEVPGTYDYFCSVHLNDGMVGRIVVGEPGGPAEDSPIPYGTVPDSQAIVDQGAIAPETASD